MTTFERSFDEDAWRWTWSARRAAGPAGTASVWLSDEVRVDADAWDGVVTSIVAEAIGADGRRSSATDALLATVVDDADSLRPDVEQRLSRLARVTEVAVRRSAFGDDVAAFDDEAAALRSSLGLAVDRERVAPAADAGPGRAAALDRLRARPHDLGALAPTGLGAGWRVTIDPSTVPAGILDLARGVTVAWDHDRRHLTVDATIVPDIYAVEVQRLSCVVVERSTDTPIAIGQLGVGLGDGNTAAGVAALVVSGSRPLDDLELVITDAPSRLPSGALRTARAATELADAAAAASRLGDAVLAADLLERSLHRWAATGRRFDAVGPAIAEPPFDGDLTLG